MDKKNIFLILIAFLLSFDKNFAQSRSEKLLKKADQYYADMAYVKAKKTYLKIAHDTSNYPAIKGLANCYYNLQDWANSEHFLAKVVQQRNVEPHFFLLYAQALKSIGKYNESDLWMEKFRDSEGQDLRGIYYENKKLEVRKILFSESKFTITPALFNSPEADFGAVLYEDELVFASARNTKPRPLAYSFAWNEKPFLDLYFVSNPREKQPGKPKLFFPSLSSKFHDGPVTFSRDNKTLYLTRNNYNHHKAGTSAAGVNMLKLYAATHLNGRWSSLKEIPFSTDEYSVGHAALTANGSKMYFVSDMPGGFGGTDIYEVGVNQDGSFGTPVNLGKQVNTEGNEMFPFIDLNGNLFFSSDGHPGLGRLDIFHTHQKKDKSWTFVRNAGIGINSPADDFSFYMMEDVQTGYFSSNRAGGKGDDDVYEFKIIKPITSPFLIRGKIQDFRSRLPLEGVFVKMINTRGKVLDSTLTASGGEYSFEVEPETAYHIQAYLVNYIPKKILVPKDSLNEVQHVFLSNLLLEIETPFSIVVEAFNPGTGESIKEFSVLYKNLITGERETIESSADGKATKFLKNKLNDVLNYEITVVKEGYFDQVMVCNKTISSKAPISLKSALNKPVIGMDLSKVIEIKPIYFDLGKSFIRQDAAVELDKIVAVMLKYPGMLIELGSHSDSRGSDQANLILSGQRAQASVDYIVSKGIAADRIIGKGYGETMLLNKCKNSVKCKEQEHSVNRRTEFIIKKI